MSILSESAHADTARELKAMLLDAATGKDWGDHRSVVKAFARKHLLEAYKQHCGDSYSLEDVDKEVLKLYE